jgi:hypothetical protein
MEHLSSCYFCGVAVEAGREAPAVTGDPPGLALPPVGERPTVTLCSSCRGKLDRIVAGLAGGGVDAGKAAGGGDATPREEPPEAAEGRAATGIDGSAAAGSADAEEGGPATAGTERSTDSVEDDDPVGIDPDAEIFGDTDAVALDDAGDDGEGSAAEASGGATDDADPAVDGDDEGADGSGADDAGNGENPERSYTASQAAGGRATSSHGRDAYDDDADAEGGVDAEGDPGGDGSDASEDADPVPREAYDKVVRLLQNREFPVERGDILTVASNAYGLERGDCEAALDRLQRQGAIDRDGDRLYRG